MIWKKCTAIILVASHFYIEYNGGYSDWVPSAYQILKSWHLHLKLIIKWYVKFHYNILSSCGDIQTKPTAQSFWFHFSETRYAILPGSMGHSILKHVFLQHTTQEERAQEKDPILHNPHRQAASNHRSKSHGHKTANVFMFQWADPNSKQLDS